MTVVLTIAGWLLAGIAATRITAPADASWWQWIPMAAFFGPMWLVIANERRRVEQGIGSAEP